MWIFKQFVFFWLNGGYQGPTKTECPGGREWSSGAAWSTCMCAAGAGPGGRRSQAELGVCAQLITAMHCTAHVPRAYRDRLLFRAFLPLQPGPVSHPLGHVSSMEVLGGQGPGRAWASPPGAPSHPEPCPPRSGGGPL